MTTNHDHAPIRFMGMPASPYTRKMLAVLRYRRIPHQFMIGMPAMHAPPELPQPKVALLPTFYLPNEDGEMEALVDSTPLIRRLERDFAGRRVIPADPVVAFVNDLVEEYADEWLTKSVMHYRWSHAANIDRAKSILPLSMQLSLDDEQQRQLGENFAERQMGRRHVVGSNDITAPVIEGSYQRFLKILSDLLQAQPYVMGQRPGSADFALFGQLTALTHFDPTPMALALELAPRVYAWVERMEDQSGVEVSEADWWHRDALPDVLRPLLAEIGRVYVPVMLANAAAIDAGEEQFTTQVNGDAWKQQAFPYQRSCLQTLIDSYVALNDENRRAVDALLEGSGCAALVEC